MLGCTVRTPIEHVEVFAAPDHVTEVRLASEEVASVCPVTSQPDLSTVEITYVPDRWCVETKSLKLYLWGFRQRPVFAEALAAEIAGEIMATAQPAAGDRGAHAAPAGGITVSATAELTRGARRDTVATDCSAAPSREARRAGARDFCELTPIETRNREAHARRTRHHG